MRAISQINKIISEANEIAKKNYCRCSTNVKIGAISSIAHRESQLIKYAIRTKGTKHLKNDLWHYNDLIIKMQIEISNASTSLTNTDVIQLQVAHVNEHVAHLSEHPNTTQQKVVSPLHRICQAKKMFALLPPNVDEEMYSPIQAILFTLNNISKEKTIMVDLPKENGNYVVRKMSQYIIIQALISKKYIPITQSPMYAMISAYNQDTLYVPK